MKKTFTKTFTPIHFLSPYCGALLLLILLQVQGFAQSKTHRVAGPNGSLLHITENSKYTETKRTNGRGYFSIKVSFSIHHIEGNTNQIYRGFALGGNQKPQSLSFDLQAYNSKKGTLFSRRQIYVNSENKRSYTYEVSFSSTGYVNSIQVRNLKAQFQGGSSSVSSQKQLIDRYYQTASNLQQHIRSLNNLKYQDADELLDTQHKLHDLHQVMDRIRSNQFFQKLNLTRQDPAKLKLKMQRLTRRLNDADTKFHNAEQQWHVLYYNKFVSTGNTRYLDLAIERNRSYAPPYIEKSSIALKNGRPDDALRQIELLQNNASTNSSVIATSVRGLYQNIFDYYVRLGRNQRNYQDQIAYYRKAQNICGKRGANIRNCQGQTQRLIAGARTQHYQGHLRIFENLLQRANYKLAYQRLNMADSFQQRFGQQITNRHSILYQKLYDRIIQKSQSQVNMQQYQQALNDIQFAENIAQQRSNVYASAAYRQVKTAAHSGVFDQQFRQSQQAVASGNLSSAASFLRQSRQYYQQNQQFIQNAGQKQQNLDRQYELLIQKVIKRGQDANSQKRFTEGLKQFKLADGLLGDIQTSIINQGNFSHDIQLGLATAYVGLAKADNVAKKYRESLNDLGLAESALTKLNNANEAALLRKDIEFYKKDAIQKLIQQDIDDAYAALKVDNLSKAMQLSQEINSLTNKYNYTLAQDEKMNRRYTILKKAIQDKECELNKKSYEQLLQQARSQFDSKKFVEGWGLLDQAITKAQANTACGIGDQIAQQLKTRYKNAHQYTLDWQKLKKLAGYGTQSQYDRAMKLFKQVANNYKQYNLKIFGIETPDLKAYFSETVNASFWAYGIVYFLKKQDHTFANELINKYLDRVTHKEGIRRLAGDVARVDFGLDDKRLERNRCKTFLETYRLPTSRSLKRRVRWFKKAYCRLWNKLRKEKS